MAAALAIVLPVVVDVVPPGTVKEALREEGDVTLLFRLSLRCLLLGCALWLPRRSREPCPVDIEVDAAAEDTEARRDTSGFASLSGACCKLLLR